MLNQHHYKEDLELIAALAAGTAGFIKNNVNNMMVGDSKFVKAEVEPRDVVNKAKDELYKEYRPNLQSRDVIKPPQNTPPPELVKPYEIVTPHLEKKVEAEDNKQLMFNFDNTPTAQNIYYKLNLILEKIESINGKIHHLSEQVNKKKVSKTKET